MSLEADAVLVAVGRRPCVTELELDKVDVSLQPKGFVNVKPLSCYQTTLPGVYAIGDVIGGAMLAHKAMEEGVVLAEHLGHQRGCQVNYGAIPSVVYTMPEIACVGLTEAQAKVDGSPIKAASFPFTANGRAKATGATTGFVKLVAHAETDRLLGMHIMGEFASEMIHCGVMTLEYGGSSEDLARATCAHPTLSEAIKEAACAVTGLPLHM